jgi:hypothetical protein
VSAGNNFKEIAIALHAYADAHGGRFPPAVIRGKDGRPLYSWRVAILPYLEEEQLYQEFHLDEPWDSPHNLPLLERMPKVYAPVGRTGAAPGETYCQAIVGPGAAFEGDVGLRPAKDFPDGAGETVMLAEAAEAVPWMKPADLAFDPAGPLPRLGGVFQGKATFWFVGSERSDGWSAAFADGSVRFVPRAVSEQTVRAAFTRAGGEPAPRW